MALFKRAQDDPSFFFPFLKNFHYPILVFILWFPEKHNVLSQTRRAAFVLTVAFHRLGAGDHSLEFY